MHGIAAITGNMHRSLRYFVLLEHITSLQISLEIIVANGGQIVKARRKEIFLRLPILNKRKISFYYTAPYIAELAK